MYKNNQNWYLSTYQEDIELVLHCSKTLLIHVLHQASIWWILLYHLFLMMKILF